MEKTFFVMASCGFNSSLFGPFTQVEAEELRSHFINDPIQERQQLYVIFDMKTVQDPQITLSYWRQESRKWPCDGVPPMRFGRDYSHDSVVSRDTALEDARRKY